MRRRFPVFVASFLLTPGLAGPVHAASNLVAVSARGVDVAGCGSVASPCRTLQYAHNVVAPGGQLDVMESGEYGALTITKSVNVVYAGTGVALVQPTGAGKNGVQVFAGAADVVRLRGLTIEGGGVGLNGVVFRSGARLEIADSAIRNFTSNGVTLAGANSRFSVIDTVISDNAGFGLRAIPAATNAKGEMDGVQLLENAMGGALLENTSSALTEVVVTKSVAMGNRAVSPGAGFRVAGAGARLTLRETTSKDNRIGVSANNGGVLRVSGSTLVGNDLAAEKQGGVIESFGDNVVRANANDSLATLTPVSNH